MLSVLLLILKSAKFGKALLMSGSMLLSLFIYMKLYGLPFAAGFIILMFVHEMGHYIAAKQRGLDVSIPMFIPFVGASIVMKHQPHNVETEAYVALAGPLVGTLGALAFYFIGRDQGSDQMLSLAYSGMILNLFNMIPISPLDGGRVTAVLSPRIWFAGAPLLIALYLYQHNPLLILIGIMALPQLNRAWHYNPKAPENQAYYAIGMEQRVFYMAYYLLLTGFLALMAYDLDHILHPLAR